MGQKCSPAGTAIQFFFRSNVVNQHFKSDHQPPSQGAYNDHEQSLFFITEIRLFLTIL